LYEKHSTEYEKKPEDAGRCHFARRHAEEAEVVYGDGGGELPG
jgi:hypothetical protein